MSQSAPSPQTMAQPEPHESYQRFKREAWWQITFPVVLVSLLSIGTVVYIGILSFNSDTGQPASIVADYGLGLLILLALLGGLILVAISVALIYGVSLLIQKTPPYTAGAQRIARQVYETVDEWTSKIAGVFISARAALAGLEYFLKKNGIIPDLDREP